MKCGIVGLPNVGKSTLFNALVAKIQAESADYPFCTIEPNHGFALVNDPMLYKLAEAAGSEKVIPTKLEVVDIAGLVKGASQGQGLGNKFLSHIREVDLILHMVRCFDKVGMETNPIQDIEIINTELVIADIESLEKRRLKKSQQEKAAINQAIQLLTSGKTLGEDAPEGLITTKKCIYVANTPGNENEYSEQVRQYSKEHKVPFTTISADLEMNLIGESKDTLKEFGINANCLDVMVQETYYTLGLKSFFTIGKQEARAWTVSKDATALDCAGKIHSDIARGFIAAEVTRPEDYLKGGAQLRLEGKGYVVQEGDIINIRFNV